MNAASESPDLHVTLDLLDLAIDAAVTGLTREEVEAVAEAVWLADYYKMFARRDGKDLDTVTPEDVHYGLQEALYDHRCHNTKHPYFVQAVVQALMAKRRAGGSAYGASEFAAEFPDLYRKLRDEQLDLADEGRIIHFGWRPPQHKQPLPILPWLKNVPENDVVTGLEFLEDLHEALAGGSVAELPLEGKRRRWRKMWDEGRDFRRDYERSRERITGFLKENGELTAVDRLPEEYPNQERYRVEADPVRIAVLIDAFMEEYERRPGVRIKAVSTVPGPVSPPRRPRPHERAKLFAQPSETAADTSAPSTQGPALDWIDTCERIVALASQDLLSDILVRIDLSPDDVVVAAGPTRIVKELFPYDSIPTRNEYTKRRKEVGAMLQRKGVLTVSELIPERDWQGQKTGAGWKDKLRVRADRATVYRVLGLLEERLNPTKPSPRPNPVAVVAPQRPRPEVEPPVFAHTPQTAVSDPYKVDVERTHRVERARFPYAVGATVLAAIILAVLAFFFVPLRDWIKAKYFPKSAATETVIAPADTTKKLESPGRTTAVRGDTSVVP